ncbi:MAG: DUF2007 domain-containing protein [Candidatus Marinimicrobia bacterium]|nr:DUF2007 domain-containing protein [Candidatus Neomarinimicrobiota bacterium]
MYCPLCQAEYKPEIKHCADCNVTLVEALPEETKLEEVNWVEVGDLTGRVYAEMVMEILNKNDIPNYVKSDWLTAIRGISGTGSTTSVITLYVPEDNLEAAKAIVSDLID